jgi:hypothetical protein
MICLLPLYACYLLVLIANRGSFAASMGIDSFEGMFTYEIENKQLQQLVLPAFFNVFILINSTRKRERERFVFVFVFIAISIYLPSLALR